jgi:uncharacterized protein (TIGR02300 family)
MADSKEITVAKPELGVKRACNSCGANFYDLLRQPITCPKCGAVFTPEVILKSRNRTPGYARTAVPVFPVDALPEKSENADEVEEAEDGESDVAEDQDDPDDPADNDDPTADQA